MMITVDLGDGVIREMDDATLDKKELHFENSHEDTYVTEYFLHGVKVHRSAHVKLKEGIGIESILGRMG